MQSTIQKAKDTASSGIASAKTLAQNTQTSIQSTQLNVKSVTETVKTTGQNTLATGKSVSGNTTGLLKQIMNKLKAFIQGLYKGGGGGVKKSVQQQVKVVKGKIS
jgi:hypothetical protein